ncbi:serine protease [Aphelenchoides avenae]|nr:serine protease [Aphelenchus avenae]
MEDVHFFNNSVENWEEDLMSTGHDIVAIKLNESVAFSDTISPICLSDARVEDHTSFVVAVGWGRHYPTDNGSYIDTEILEESIIPLRPIEFCRQYTQIADTEICAGSDHRDTTPGDSGGPIQFELNKRWHLAGDTSRGPYPENEQFVGHGVYARLSEHCEWLASVTKGEVTCTKTSSD